MPLAFFLGVGGYVAMALLSVGHAVGQDREVGPCMVLFLACHGALLLGAFLWPRARPVFVTFGLGALATGACAVVLVVTQTVRLTPVQFLVLVLASGVAAIVGRALTRPSGGPSLAVQVETWRSLAAHNARAAEVMEHSKADPDVVGVFKAAAAEARGVALHIGRQRRSTEET